MAKLLEISKFATLVAVACLANAGQAYCNQSELHALINRIKVLEQKQAIQSAYCKLTQPATVCGPCLCIDDTRLDRKFYCDCQNLTPKRDCVAFRQAGIKINGIYQVTQNNLKTIQVYCDQTTETGGWTVIQRRRDGSVNFNTDWNTYKIGFGSLQNEFWFGNDNIFSMQHQGHFPNGNELRVDVVDFFGKQYHAKYHKFSIGSALSKYSIFIKGFAGTAGDALRHANGMKFSTYDADNDISVNGNCAKSHKGGFWFSACHEGHPNGIYHNYGGTAATDYTAVSWLGVGSHHYYAAHVKTMEIKIRRIL